MARTPADREKEPFNELPNFNYISPRLYGMLHAVLLVMTLNEVKPRCPLCYAGDSMYEYIFPTAVAALFGCVYGTQHVDWGSGKEQYLDVCSQKQ